ncbi:fimbrial protein [Hafnia paralvei]|uniref:fimbrial protein n=1 Tax=Hafnia paralvei TaxID=546367 RepID=UPI003CFAC4ED
MKKLFLLCFISLFFCHLANAKTQYTGLVQCWTDPTMSFSISLSGSFSSGKAGTTQDFWFGNTYSFYAYCTTFPESEGDYGRIKYAKAEMDPRYPVNNHVMSISNSLDVTVKIDPYNGSSSNWIAAPFDNATLSPTYEAYSGGPQSMIYGSRGSVDITLTKDAIGGAIVLPPGIVLWKYYISTDSGNFSPNPLTMGTTAGQIIPVSTTCTINNGQAINVDFGDLESNHLKSDGPSSTVKIDVPLNYSCTSSLTQDIEITLVGSSASFEPTALKSSIADIGVVMMHDGTPVSPYGYFPSKLVNGTGSDTVTFSPIIRSGATNVQGNFTASATLVMTSA